MMGVGLYLARTISASRSLTAKNNLGAFLNLFQENYWVEMRPREAQKQYFPMLKQAIL
jgi:hypothetical protein